MKLEHNFLRLAAAPRVGGKPLLIGIDCAEHPFSFICKAMGEDWKQRLIEHKISWFSGSPNYRVHNDPRKFDLRDALVRFGGEEVCMPYAEEDLIKLLRRGQLWPGKGLLMNPWRPSHCNENSSLCWEANQDKFLLATGYALSNDGLWRKHSWCVMQTPNNNKIVETTELRGLYFGFVMDLEETVNFVSRNILLGVVDVLDETRERYAKLTKPAGLKQARMMSLG